MEEDLSAKQKIIRITYSDPDATDSSSDEEIGPIQKKSKRKVLEIALNAFGKRVVTNLKKKPKSTKFIGVRRRESGNYAAEIRNPIIKKREWLGTFPTPEEASEAYLLRKREIEEELRAKQGLQGKSKQDSVSPVLEN